MIVRSCGQSPPTDTSVKFTSGAGSQLSVAVADPVFGGNVLAVHSMVTLGGQEITGAVSSVTMITWTHVLLLPHPSDAVHVRVIVSNDGQSPERTTSVNSTNGFPVQLSVAVADPVAGGKVLSVHSIVTLAGQVMTGGTLSSTNMVCKQVLELPQSSEAIQVRLIVNS